MAVQISGNDITVPRDTTVTRNLTVGGVLTYEDVTNVDSVGLVTARTGIEIGARPGVAASISVDGNAIFSGITTVGGNIKVGSGITLSPDGDVFTTGVSTVKGIHINGTLEGQDLKVGTGVTITRDGDIFATGISTFSDNVIVNGGNITVKQSAGTEAKIQINEATTTNSFTIKQTSTEARIQTNASQPLNIRAQGGSGSTSYLAFWTRDFERLRIDTNGRVLIGHATTPNAVASIAVVGSYGASSNNTPFVYICRDEAATAITGGESLGQILFASNDGYRGAAIEGVAEGAWSGSSSDGYLAFKTTPDNSTVPTERLRITGTGQLEFRNIDTAAETGAASQVNWIGPYVYQHSKTVTATTNGSGAVTFDLGCPFYYDGTTFEYFINASPTDNTNFTTTYQKGFFTKARGGGIGQFEVIKNDSAKAGCSLGTPTAGNPNGHQFNIAISGAVANKEYRATILYTGISRYAGYT